MKITINLESMLSDFQWMLDNIDIYFAKDKEGADRYLSLGNLERGQRLKMQDVEIFFVWNPTYYKFFANARCGCFSSNGAIKWPHTEQAMGLASVISLPEHTPRQRDSVYGWVRFFYEIQQTHAFFESLDNYAFQAKCSAKIDYTTGDTEANNNRIKVSIKTNEGHHTISDALDGCSDKLNAWLASFTSEMVSRAERYDFAQQELERLKADLKQREAEERERYQKEQERQRERYQKEQERQRAEAEKIEKALGQLCDAPDDEVFESRSKYLYLMKDDSLEGTYKIGVSVNPEYRENTLQAQRPSVKLVGKWDGLSCYESAWHRYFAEQRIRGEWFQLTNAQVRLFCATNAKGCAAIESFFVKVA